MIFLSLYLTIFCQYLSMVGLDGKKVVLEPRKCIECASSQGYRAKQHGRKYTSQWNSLFVVVVSFYFIFLNFILFLNFT